MRIQRSINVFNTVDKPALFIYLALVVLGWLNIYAAVYNEEHSSIFDLSQRYGKQLIWIAAAIVTGWIIFLIDFRFYEYFAYPIYIFFVLILAAVLVLGTEIHGARAWFSLGGFNIQPAEFAKFATALALARLMSSYNFQLLNLRSALLIGIILTVPMGLIALQPDMGSTLVFASFAFMLYREGLPRWIFAIFLLLPVLFIISMFFSAATIIVLLVILSLAFFGFSNPTPRYIIYAVIMFTAFTLLLSTVNYLFHLNYSMAIILLATTVLSATTAGILSLVFKIRYVFFSLFLLAATLGFSRSVNYAFDKLLKPHQQQRINILLGLESDAKGVGYNVNQSMIAIGSGGFTGKGYLQGTQTKYNFVPEQTTDFIFCTVGEEWGFLGSLLIVALYTWLAIRLIIMAERQRSMFARIYGYGVTSVLFFHVSINIGMTIGIFPVIGIPLPFFSYGGSSLWAFTILLFIFLNFDARRLEIMH